MKNIKLKITIILERLQGKGFQEQYTPTDQIQVCPIQWSFKNTEDIVKVSIKEDNDNQ